MTLEEGIIHAEDVARMNHEAAKHLTDEHPTQAEKCEACAKEHERLSEWLKELKAYRELIDKTEEALGRFELDNTATYTKFYWDCWKVKEANE